MNTLTNKTTSSNYYTDLLLCAAMNAKGSSDAIKFNVSIVDHNDPIRSAAALGYVAIKVIGDDRIAAADGIQKSRAHRWNLRYETANAVYISHT